MRRGKEVKVSKLPACDFCGCAAVYDAATKHGPWANMCEEHWVKHGVSEELGVGIGQRLVLEGACND